MASKINTVTTRVVLALAVSMSFGMVSAAQAGEDQCQTWTHRGYPVEMGVCSYPDGKSGYTVIKNNGNRAANICWTVVANDGGRQKSCHSHMGAGETDRSSAYQCGTNTKHGGCSQIILESYEVNR